MSGDFTWTLGLKMVSVISKHALHASSSKLSLWFVDHKPMRLSSTSFIMAFMTLITLMWRVIFTPFSFCSVQTLDKFVKKNKFYKTLIFLNPFSKPFTTESQLIIIASSFNKTELLEIKLYIKNTLLWSKTWSLDSYTSSKKPSTPK